MGVAVVVHLSLPRILACLALVPALPRQVSLAPPHAFRGRPSDGWRERGEGKPGQACRPALAGRRWCTWWQSRSLK
ncbi:hypothetical protein PCLA_07f0147 [Pseudomonas citronellolis]|nr:hypothetical protein PCLA_07f0147 [Pseudomonas citronellolis]